MIFRSVAVRLNLCVCAPLDPHTRIRFASTGGLVRLRVQAQRHTEASGQESPRSGLLIP